MMLFHLKEIILHFFCSGERGVYSVVGDVDQSVVDSGSNIYPKDPWKPLPSIESWQTPTIILCYKGNLGGFETVCWHV